MSLTASDRPNVFLSYSREDQAVARQFAEGLQNAGFSVWWDQTLRTGEAYDDVTEQALRGARAVVVLWSKTSVVSRWVRSEATVADRQKTLMPAMIEPCDRPVMFELTQTAELSGWNGDASVPAWRALVDDVRRLVNGASAALTAFPATTPRSRSSADARPSIAVLPFLNLSSDREQEYFSDGLSEEILNQLARIPALRVIGRTSSFAFKGRGEDLRRIGEILGVKHILEGSVRRHGNQLRITAQLIDPADGAQLWSESYNRLLDNIFDIQSDIARSVAEKLRVTLAARTDKHTGTRNIEAYQQLMVSRRLLSSSDPDSVIQAVSHAERAVQLDPLYLDGWSSLLAASAHSVAMPNLDRRAMSARHAEIVERILHLAPDSAFADEARFAQAWRENRHVEAIRLGNALQEANPGRFPFAAFIFAQTLAALGRLRDGYEAARVLRETDPLNELFASNESVNAEALGMREQADQALALAMSIPGSNKPVLLAHLALVRALTDRNHESIVRLAEASVAASPRWAPIHETGLRHVDDPSPALRALERLLNDERYREDIFAMDSIANWASYFGAPELSLQAMRRSADSEALLWSWGMTMWRPIHREMRRLPGFKLLLRDLGAVDFWRATGLWGDFCKPLGADDYECR